MCSNLVKQFRNLKVQIFSNLGNCFFVNFSWVQYVFLFREPKWFVLNWAIKCPFKCSAHFICFMFANVISSKHKLQPLQVVIAATLAMLSFCRFWVTYWEKRLFLARKSCLSQCLSRTENRENIQFIITIPMSNVNWCLNSFFFKWMSRRTIFLLTNSVFFIFFCDTWNETKLTKSNVIFSGNNYYIEHYRIKI